MEPITEVLELLKRQSELEAVLGQPSGIHVTEEREIHVLRERLQRYPHAVAAILRAARALNRPVDTLQEQDVRRLE